MHTTDNYLTALLFFVAPGVLNAASFNCSKAETRTEKLVCANAVISRLDEQLSSAYRQARLVVSANRDAVKAWQRTWLFFKRDDCSDVACLEKVYRLQIAELNEYAQTASKDVSVSGQYDRYFEGKPAGHPATLNLFVLGNNRVRVVGSALWIGNADMGILHTGEINGIFSLDGNRLQNSDNEANGCRLTITFHHDALIVSDDNMQCGGLNVSFNGEYKRIVKYK